MAECERTLDGKHHFGERYKRSGVWPFWTYQTAWECVCATPAPAGMIPKLERLAAEVERINELVLCAEPGEQGRLL